MAIAPSTIPDEAKMLVPPPGSTQNSGQNMTPLSRCRCPFQPLFLTIDLKIITSTIGSATAGHYSPYSNGGYPSTTTRCPKATKFACILPPHPYSPTNLPPPQPQTYSFINGTPVQYSMARTCCLCKLLPLQAMNTGFSQLTHRWNDKFHLVMTHIVEVP